MESKKSTRLKVEDIWKAVRKSGHEISLLSWVSGSTSQVLPFSRCLIRETDALNKQLTEIMDLDTNINKSLICSVDAKVSELQSALTGSSNLCNVPGVFVMIVVFTLVCESYTKRKKFRRRELPMAGGSGRMKRDNWIHGQWIPEYADVPRTDKETRTTPFRDRDSIATQDVRLFTDSTMTIVHDSCVENLD